MSATWYCVRQRAGPLVKECRALRPRLGPEDTDTDRKEKLSLRRKQNGTFDRRQVDKLELRLAVMGYKSTMHTLTFSDEFLPQNFRETRSSLQAFFKRTQRRRERIEKPPAYDYVYAIEGLHGERRYHIHLITPDNELCDAEVDRLWRGGLVDHSPVLKRKGGFRRLAEYLNKERTDGILIPIGRHPWSCSRTLTAKLPQPEKWTSDTNAIDVPSDAIYVRRGYEENDFGAYYYASWIEAPTRATDLNRACARAINLEM